MIHVDGGGGMRIEWRTARHACNVPRLDCVNYRGLRTTHVSFKYRSL